VTRATFFNHSCDPNCWFDGDNKITTRRAVKAGHELTYDYCTSRPIFATNGIDPCRCKTGTGMTKSHSSGGSGIASSCRGRVTWTDYRRPELRARYGNHWYGMWIQKMAKEGLITNAASTKSASASTAASPAPKTVSNGTRNDDDDDDQPEDERQLDGPSPTPITAPPVEADAYDPNDDGEDTVR